MLNFYGSFFTLIFAVLLVGANFYMRPEYFTISNCVFNFNILAVVFSEILGGSKFTLGGSVPPVRSLAEKLFVHEASSLLCLMAFLISTF